MGPFKDLSTVYTVTYSSHNLMINYSKFMITILLAIEKY